jgi:hypothetical protein
MIGNVVGDGRVLSLRAAEWLMLIAGERLRGFKFKGSGISMSFAPTLFVSCPHPLRLTNFRHKHV